MFLFGPKEFFGCFEKTTEVGFMRHLAAMSVGALILLVVVVAWYACALEKTGAGWGVKSFSRLLR